MRNVAIIGLIDAAQKLIDALPETQNFDVNLAVVNLQEAIRFSDAFIVPIEYESVFRIGTDFHSRTIEVQDAIKIYDRYGVAITHDADAISVDAKNNF